MQNDFAARSRDYSALSLDERHTLETQVIPTALRWLVEHPVGSNMYGHAQKTLEYWGRMPAKQGDAAPTSADPLALASGQMQRGEAVSESYLYGRIACEMIQRRLVDKETMTRYRSAAFLKRRDLYGEEAALAWEAERKAAHEAAKPMLRDPQNSKEQAA